MAGPLDVAAEYSHEELCKFIADKVEDKNPIADSTGFT